MSYKRVNYHCARSTFTDCIGNLKPGLLNQVRVNMHCWIFVCSFFVVFQSTVQRFSWSFKRYAHSAFSSYFCKLTWLCSPINEPKQDALAFAVWITLLVLRTIWSLYPLRVLLEFAGIFKLANLCSNECLDSENSYFGIFCGAQRLQMGIWSGHQKAA